MPDVVLESGCLWLRDGSNDARLTAEEIFAVVFEDADSQHDMPVTADLFHGTGLEFRSSAADPIVVLESDCEEKPQHVMCRLVAKGIGFEAPVSMADGELLDYAIDGSVWMPLPPGSLKAAGEFLHQVGLAQFGCISLAQYLQVLRTSTPAISVEDRTHEAFASSRLSSTLAGDVPMGFVGSLYPYQNAGFRWLAFMRSNGLGCIIADEMGLGKTVQVICLLLTAKLEEKVPCLVIAPATLLENWRREIERFAPPLRVCVHRGTHRTGFPEDLRQYDVVISSYETAVADVSLLRNIHWDTCVLDEAQAIKNPSAKRTRRLKTLPRSCTVAMTGTPVENHLTDLWSITDFAVPSLLGRLAEFERNHPDDLRGARSLEPILTPIILRRLVRDVAQDLPERIDIPQPLVMDSKSANVYEMLRQEAASGPAATLAALVKLRMFCTHPWLSQQFTHCIAAADCSVKFQRLLEIMEEIVADGGKALVFSSYQASIDLLARELADQFGIWTATIDGRTPVEARQETVDQFARLEAPAALILNPRAAGTGLNITAANHVIHFNLEWNPAVEDQATARAHRRGQQRSVTVHRLFYVNTVEDVINDRMERKRELANAAVVGTDGGQADVQDILRALRVSPANQH